MSERPRQPARAGSAKSPASLEVSKRYLEYLAHERRLSANTLENYGRDIATLVALAGGRRQKRRFHPSSRSAIWSTSRTSGA